jgi:hypothetical protein
VYKVLLSLSIFMVSCSLPAPIPPEPIEIPYFYLECYRATPLSTEMLHWVCQGEPSTELIEGEIKLFYDGDNERLTFCADGATLASGNEMVDTLVNTLEGRCLILPPEFGDFSWTWTHPETLQIIWTEGRKLVIYIPPEEEYQRINAEAFYYVEE